MYKVFPLTNNKSWKTLLVQDDRLLLINRSYNTPEEFLKGYEDGGISNLLKKKKVIEIFQITTLKHREKDATALTIVSNNKKEMLEFASGADLRTVTDFISGIQKLNPATEKVTILNAIKTPGFALLFTALIGWLVYEDALTIENGGYVDVSGRRALTKRFFAWVAESLGSKGTLIVFGLLCAVCLYFLFKGISEPPNEIVYA